MDADAISNTTPLHDPTLNAVAGPSSLPHLPSLFLLPQAPPAPPHLLESTQDLLSKFHLLPAYDKFVRPLLAPEFDAQSSNHPPTTPAVPSLSDKGKGKERDPGTPGVASAATPGAQNDGDDEDGKDGKKKKNTYRHLIKGIPGKHSVKKDDFLTTMIQIPPKQHIPVVPFDSRTQTDAFTVSLEGLKGWNIHALVPESTQAREDRKKRKELKKLAKAQGSAGPLSASTPLPSTPFAASTPTQPAPQPVRMSTPVPAPRGVKREFEDGAVGQPNTQGPGATTALTNGNAVSAPSPAQTQRPAVSAAKAGVPGARPRPLKKQRVVSRSFPLRSIAQSLQGGVTPLLYVFSIFPGCRGSRQTRNSIPLASGVWGCAFTLHC
ncbi:hypothetical protein BC834DRAFT_903697 [Gloeopeniophorella convolvens]|nr:hypothetical protein BC834DRAFT_903697 [Gloeopeniophorella convolvens]